MKIVVAVDSFKGSLTSLEAGEAIRLGIERTGKQHEVIIRPLGDGGEGTLHALTLGTGGKKLNVRATGPLGEQIDTEYGILGDGKTAMIEMSMVAGLPLVPVDKRNPMLTTTYGVGELILSALEQGCRHFVIGIGGSATNDGGAGMLQALGFGLLDQNDQPIPYGAKGLEKLVRITKDQVPKELQECTFRIACDVDNPLCGPNGASMIYGKQKGATDDMLVQLDRLLYQFAEVAKESGFKVNEFQEGSGAAGGLGYAFTTFLQGELESGIKIVMEETNLEAYIREADLVITGEGRLDAQTIYGKAPIGVAGMAKKYQKPVIAFSGCVTREATICNSYGIDAYFPIQRECITTKEAMNSERAKQDMIQTVEQVFRLFDIIYLIS